MKSVCHFKENHLQCLLPMIKSEFLSEHVGKLVLATSVFGRVYRRGQWEVTEGELLPLWSERCHHWETVGKSVNHHFPRDHSCSYKSYLL